ncbi:hypothetical protein DPMN_093052 [Dreissena polymorpha]|uniref:Uncharacterized protein n=1 Tax=Dreissena polymorpha TaxID=45954 RepID=A0A9D4L2Q3_DREPO|nr:hypothetical protein DPMN_093052 [Dreissena polymorpha]
MQEDLKKLKEKGECNLLSLERTYQRIKEEIDTVRQKINKELDRLERATMQEIEKLIANSTIYITKERDKCDSIQESMQCLSKVIHEVCNKSSKLLFIALEKYQQQIKDSELFLKESKDTHEYGMEFAPSYDIEKYLLKCAGLGRVCQPNKVISLQKKSEYSVKMAPILSMRSTCAICELPTGETLVLSYNQNKVKLFDKKNQFLSDCEVSYHSHDMCLMSPSKVVVTTNDGDIHGLHMIAFRNNVLQKGWKIQLPHRCVGIAHHPGALYVTCGKALYQYTLIGTLVKKLYEDTTGNNTGSGHELFYKAKV